MTQNGIIKLIPYQMPARYRWWFTRAAIFKQPSPIALHLRLLTNPAQWCTLSNTIQVQEPESDEDFGQVTEPLMDIVAAIVTHT